MRTILVANRKGGVGKTTVAITIASALAAQGRGAVALADADPQKSALRWLKARPADAATLRGLDWTDAGEIGDAPKGLEWLVIDAPGALKGGRASKLIAETEELIVPVMPSFFDIDATRRFLKELEEMKRVRKGKVGLRVLANRAQTRGRATERLRTALARIDQEPLGWITERAAYAELAERGLGIFDDRRRLLEPLREQWVPVLAALE
ncbi:ParA family protein [Amaricoccus sp. W119]|uniref:ParA family protein n=1 Tax=Amaricoccus sp. W119 TaxID=3391833 RepID=UPI0039A4F90D